ncbi:MAG: hypothetical protein J6Y35_07175 [Bacteroidales bacterium]|nr:hypothetical protein [Bacteroidales bacterium]
MIDLIQNNEQWSATREKLNEVIATVNVLSGEYTAKPVFSSVDADFGESKKIDVAVKYVNNGNWPMEQLAVEVSTEGFESDPDVRVFAAEKNITSGGVSEGTVKVKVTVNFNAEEEYSVRAVWAGMVTSEVVVAS